MSEPNHRNHPHSPHRRPRPTLHNGNLATYPNTPSPFNLRDFLTQLFGGLIAVCLVVLFLKIMMLALQYTPGGGGNGYYRQGGRGWLGQENWVGEWEQVRAGEEVKGGPQVGDEVVHVHVRVPAGVRGF
jgi:hypothetical protein